MTTLSEIMTPAPLVVGPDTPLTEAAQEMDRLDVGILPVCEEGRLVGTLTDRDITVRATSVGRDPDEGTVAEAMTTEPRCCSLGASVEEAETLMAEMQIRRLPVVDEHGILVGIVSLGDMAAEHQPGTGQTLDRISRPPGPDRDR